MTPGQLELPLLTAEQLGTITAAREAIERSLGSALAGRRWHEADELERIGNDLLQLIDEAHAAHRANHPAHRPTNASKQGGTAGQADTGSHRRTDPEPNQ